MGKRERRRKRQRGKATPPAATTRILYPSSAQPLLEVHLEPGTPDEVADLCRAYWEFTTPGTWARHVSAIGSTTQVYKAVRDACHAALLTVLCPECTAPITVSSRSEMAATGHWADDFPLEAVDARASCADCLDAAKALRAQEAALEKQREGEARKRRVNSAGEWLERAADVDEALAYPKPKLALALLAMAEIMQKSGKPFGPLDGLRYTLTGTSSGDIELFRTLFPDGWVIPTVPATTDCFTYDDEGNATGVYITSIPWTLPRWLGSTPEQAIDTAITDMRKVLSENVESVRVQVVNLEAVMAVDYLNGLLTTKYNETPIPEHRLPDAFDIAHKALKNGFSLEQMVAVAWSAAAGSVAWGQRTPGLKPGSVSSAAVTNLERRIGYAKDRPVPDYDLPNWVARPATHATALRFLEQNEAASEALSTFRSLHQRVNSRPLDAVELDDDLAEGGRSEPRDWDKWMEQLRSGAPSIDTSRTLTFASVSPDGECEVQTTTLNEMKRIAGQPHGMTERLPIDGTQTLDSFVPVFADSSVHKPNPVATRMIELLGGGYGTVNGTVVFFQTGRSHSPQSLDEDHQQLIHAAHHAATVRR